MEIIMEIKSLFANGKEKAFTMSYDDGNYDGDKQLIGIFNKYGIKGTFHLNGHNYVPGGWAYDKVDELKKLYSGHEVSMHGYTHPFFNSLPNGEKFFELYEDKKALEGFAGYPIRGMSYPFGDYDDKTRATSSFGILPIITRTKPLKCLKISKTIHTSQLLRFSICGDIPMNITKKTPRLPGMTLTASARRSQNSAMCGSQQTLRSSIMLRH